MLTISVLADVQRCVAALNAMSNKQVPYATARALNDLAFQVQRAERDNLQKVLKHPRPFTVNAVVVDKATKTTLTAVVSIRPEVAKYLQPYETGGVHVLPGPMLLDPKDIQLDQYGQLTKGTMAKLRQRPDIYIGPIATKTAGVINGVWQRLSISRKGNVRRQRLKGSRSYDPTQGALRLLIRFGIALPVTKHLGFHARAVATVRANFHQAFLDAMTKALATARP